MREVSKNANIIILMDILSSPSVETSWSPILIGLVIVLALAVIPLYFHLRSRKED